MIAFILFMLFFGSLAYLGLRREPVRAGRGGHGGRRGRGGGDGAHGQVYITYYGDQ